MKREIYKVNCPKHIVFGDPMYINSKDEESKELVADFKPPRSFEARVILEEDEDQEKSIYIYLAPKEIINLYSIKKKYDFQKETIKNIRIDTAQYDICIDDRIQPVKTYGDGCWGYYYDIYHYCNSQKMIDVILLIIDMPEDINFKEMKEILKYLCEGIKAINKNHKK